MRALCVLVGSVMILALIQAGSLMVDARKTRQGLHHSKALIADEKYEPKNKLGPEGLRRLEDKPNSPVEMTPEVSTARNKKNTIW